jgi:putative ATP-dependent endonuclease of OLD family
VHIESITLSGFRCFGPAPVTVALGNEITALVGPNAAGKTALLVGLGKLFGVSRAQRTVHRTDFHVAAGADPESREPRELCIEVMIGLPELVDGTATPETIAPCFRHMRLERTGAAPVCRLRLEARWEDDGTVDGEVSQELFWVDTLDPTLKDDQKHAVSAADRGLIHMYYTPAMRNARAEIRATTGRSRPGCCGRSSGRTRRRRRSSTPPKVLATPLRQRPPLRPWAKRWRNPGWSCMTRRWTPNRD